MKKDHLYYEDRLAKASEALFKMLSEGRTADEYLVAREQCDVPNFYDQMARIGKHLNEAFAIIRTLQEDSGPIDPAKTYDLLWIDRVSNLIGKGELMQAKMTRTELLNRLSWISGEEFDEDLDEWADWMAAFEANPPAWGYR